MSFDLAGVDVSGALGVVELIGRILVGAVEALLIVPLGYVAILSLAATLHRAAYDTLCDPHSGAQRGRRHLQVAGEPAPSRLSN
jgi:hypothetical protein